MDKKLTIIIVLGCLFILVNMGIASIPSILIGTSEDSSIEPSLLTTDSEININNFEEKYTGKPLFKERQYDKNSIKTRIEDNINGKLLQEMFLYEKLPFDHLWNKVPRILTSIFAFVEPWFDVINITIAKDAINFNNVKSVIMIFKIQETSLNSIGYI